MSMPEFVPKFLTPLILEEYMRGARSVPGEWVVFQPLIYEGSLGQLTVPRGFITDLASIPKFMRGLLDVNDSHRRAAVLHDFLYCAQHLTRKQADDLLLEAMEAIGVQAWKRNAMYAAVRVGGWAYWNKRANERPANGKDFVGPNYFNVP